MNKQKMMAKVLLLSIGLLLSVLTINWLFTDGEANEVVEEQTHVVTEHEEPAVVVDVKTSDEVDEKEKGCILIEDYGDSLKSNRGMRPFYEALNRKDHKERPVRIAFFGDSFIEADILVGDFREMLQKQYGGCGVGFVSITSANSNYRPTVKHQFKGWHSYAYTDKNKKGQQKQKIGLSGYYFETDGFASVKLQGVNKYASLLDTCDQVTFFVRNPSPLSLNVKINNNRELHQIELERTNRLQAKSLDGRISSVEFQVLQSDSTASFYGIAMDGKDGVTVDNFSMRGSTGLFLCTIPDSFLSEFNEVRPYDLIVLQYGLNILSDKVTDYTNYENKMVKAVERLKDAYPQCGVLIMSVGDRAKKNHQGELCPMSGTDNLIQCQRNIARRTGSAFWNLREAMGGAGSMKTMVNSTPAMANKDYTHINFHGGKYLAKCLYDAMIAGDKKYKSKKQ